MGLCRRAKVQKGFIDELGLPRLYRLTEVHRGSIGDIKPKGASID